MTHTRIRFYLHPLPGPLRFKHHDQVVCFEVVGNTNWVRIIRNSQFVWVPVWHARRIYKYLRLLGYRKDSR